ncbi:MAG: HAD family hydrolase [Syntrophobacteraceae bacterium]
MLVADALWADRLPGDTVGIISLDVFDTVLFRDVAQPRGIFDRIQQDLACLDINLPRSLTHAFTTHRMRAERRARSLSTREDIALGDIYRYLRTQFNLDSRAVGRMKALEIRRELEAVRGVPLVTDFIRSARLSRKRIIFVSDMYLPRSVITRMLQNVGAYAPGDGIYVSGEIGLTKASGRLFKHVLRAERCVPSNMLHIGDHASSDLKIPASLGIRTLPFRQSHLSRYEKALLGQNPFRPQQDVSWQLVAGGSRKARLQNAPQHDARKTAIYRIGANIAGPILFGFALWVLRLAESRRVKRLYFMARDAQIIFEIAKKILPQTGYELELRYLYGSRQAWNLPSLFSIGEADLKWITVENPSLSIRLVALRLGLPPNTLAPSLAKAGFAVRGLEDALSPLQVTQLRELLRHAPAVKGLILDHASRARSTLLRYLDQEKVTHGEAVALVDTGWYASSQDRLNKILQFAGIHQKVYGFYFGLRTASADDLRESFFFGPTSTRDYREWGKAFISVLEVLCSADHGMTLGYATDPDGRVTPRLKEQQNRVAIDWGLQVLRTGMHAFVDSLPSGVNGIDLDEHRSRILRMIKLLIATPEPDEAELLGEFSFTSEQSEASLSCLAPPLTFKRIAESLMDKSGIKRTAITYWPEASILRSNPLVRSLIPTGTVRPFMRLIGKLENLVRS